MRWAAPLAMAIVLAASAVGASPTGREASTSRVARVASGDKRALSTVSATVIDSPAPWAATLSPVEVVNRNTGARARVRLYDCHGALDRAEATSFMRAASPPESDAGEPLDLRLVQLTVRAAYHFGGVTISIVSATRPGARGKHGSGEALDFALEGVKAPLLAAYLRGTPRAGVGIYTHPKTQYVHLDVREHSYHWIDASPPGVTWRERLLPDPKQAVRDASWTPAMDLPEACQP